MLSTIIYIYTVRACFRNDRSVKDVNKALMESQVSGLTYKI
jgi:hypothetical protein